MGIKERLVLFTKSQNISRSEFERKSCLSNGYINNIRNGMGADKVENILRAFPTLNRDWLLTGKGEMLNPSISQSVNGSHNTTVAGNGNQVNVSALIEELAAQRKLTEKAQEQVDRLLSLMEKMYK